MSGVEAICEPEARCDLRVRSNLHMQVGPFLVSVTGGSRMGNRMPRLEFLTLRQLNEAQVRVLHVIYEFFYTPAFKTKGHAYFIISPRAPPDISSDRSTSTRGSAQPPGPSRYRGCHTGLNLSL